MKGSEGQGGAGRGRLVCGLGSLEWAHMEEENVECLWASKNSQ